MKKNIYIYIYIFFFFISFQIFLYQGLAGLQIGHHWLNSYFWVYNNVRTFTYGHLFTTASFFQRLIEKSRMVMKFVPCGALIIKSGNSILIVFDFMLLQ